MRHACQQTTWSQTAIIRGCIVCGIIGYIGESTAVPILIRGLQRLEYRGYDSAGIAVVENGALYRVRGKGKVASLAMQLEDSNFTSTVGMGHTRWASTASPRKPTPILTSAAAGRS